MKDCKKKSILPLEIDPDASSGPLLICFSHLRWNFVYQRPQHLLSRAARHYRVYFVEEPVQADLADSRLEISRQKNGVIVLTPFISPRDESRLLDIQGALVRDFFRDKPKAELIWYYTPTALSFSIGLDADVVVYDCMDELSAFRGASSHMSQIERELFAHVDLVFTGGRSLFEAKRSLHRNVYLFPSSIDKEHFSKARNLQTNCPADQKAISHPRLGFFGVIDERMNMELVEEMARLRPHWQFIMIGPVVKIEPSTLPAQPNIHWLGSKDYQQLPEYLAGWDVGLMPFALNDSTRFISPTKTPEFLAAGLPVISTPITDVVRPYGEMGLVEIATQASDFIEKAEMLMNRKKADWLEKVDRYLKRQSWDKTWLQMKKKIDEHSVKYKKNSWSKFMPIGAGKPQIVRSFNLITSPKEFDWLVVGAGFSGSVMAERLAREANQKVLIIDKRPHIGGNAYDSTNAAGILVHHYGPHIFHTNSASVFSYLSKFTGWRHYEHRVLAQVDGQLLPIPINLDTINKLYNLSLTSQELSDFFVNRAEKVEVIRSSEDVVVSQIGWELYEKFFRLYTRKQWGLDPSELDKSVTARVPTRTNRDNRYFTDTYQYMPDRGYTALFEKMLDHPNITIRLGVDFHEIERHIKYRRMVYTGPIDHYFNYCFGKLPYRSLRFEHVTLEKKWHQPVAVINYPQDKDYTRVTEYKHLTGQDHVFTSLTYEYPQAEGDPYYPIPRPDNYSLYHQYQRLADSVSNTIFIGRLASYRYYNMDQVIAQALSTYTRLEAKFFKDAQQRRLKKMPTSSVKIADYPLSPFSQKAGKAAE